MTLKLEIINILISENKFISAQVLAERLQVSRRTIFNNMEDVRFLCETQGAKLITVKSRGYKLEQFYNLHLYLNEQDKIFINPNNQECKLYIIYLLLVEDTAIRISELKEIMYLSRPTIYKLVEEVKIWFIETDIKVDVSRKGISIIYGERRFRQALKNWIDETRYLIEKSESKGDFYDYFQLNKSLNSFLFKEPKEVFKIVENICEEFHIYCSLFELKNMTTLLEVIIFQNEKGNYVKLSERLKALMINFYSIEKLNKVEKIIEDSLHKKFPMEEIVYFISSLLINGDIKDHEQFNRRIKNILLDENLKQEVEVYLKTSLTLSETVYLELLQDIDFIIKREVLFQIRGSTGMNAKYYDSMLHNYRATVNIAQGLVQLISKYYPIVYHEKMICNIMFSILSAIQMNKEKLRVILLHDCDIFEYKYVVLSLQQFSFISLIYTSDSEGKLNEFLDKNYVDVVLSTIDYNRNQIEVINVCKVFNSIEIIEMTKRLNSLYQEKNYKKIISQISNENQ